MIRGRRNTEMPKQVKARAAQDKQEERLVRKLAGSHHAPADWKFHAQMVVESWAGKTPNEIAAELDCHAQTVRIHLKRVTLEGVAGLGVRPGAGRKARVTEQERSRIRRIYLREGVRWRHTPSWGANSHKDFVPKERWSSPTTPSRPRGRRPSAPTNWGKSIPRTFAPAPGWSATGQRIKALMDYSRGPEKTWVYGALRVRDGKVLTRCAASRNSKGYIASLSDIEADNPTGISLSSLTI